MEDKAVYGLGEHNRDATVESSTQHEILTDNASTIMQRSYTVHELNKSYAGLLLPVSVTWGLVALLGILGNVVVVSLFLFDRRLKRRPLKLQSICLAVVDLFSSVLIIPFEIYKHRNYFSDETKAMCKYKCIFNVTTMACTAFILVAIATNRYLVSSRPLIVYQRARYTNCRVALKVCLGILISLLIIVPLPILCGSYGTRIRDLHGNEIYSQVCGPEQKYRFSLYRYAYKYFMTGLQLVVSVILIVLYILIAREINLKWRKGGRNSVQYDRERQLRQVSSSGRLSSNIKVMFGATVTFVMSYFLYAGLSFVDSEDIPVQYFALYAFAYRIYFINCVAIPILYLKFDRRFRNCFLSFLKCAKSPLNITSKSRISSVSSSV